MDTSLIPIIDFWKRQMQKKVFFREKVREIPFNTEEVVDIIGPRRSGKSSLFSLLIQEQKIQEDAYLCVNFEDPYFIEHQEGSVIEEIVAVYLEHFSKDLQYLFFDEVQVLANWEKAISKLQSLGKYRIFVTGSSSKMLSREIATVLTGRHRSIQLFPLSFREFLVFRGIAASSVKEIELQSIALQRQFSEYLALGGFPRAVIENDISLLKTYFYDILYKDILFRYAVREKEVLEKMAVFLFTNSTKLVSIKSITTQFSISYELAVRYLEYLQEALLFFELPKFSFSVKTQQASQKKIYAIDTGLANAVSFRFSQERGRILENAVFLHFKRKGETLFYHKERHECDFLIFRDGRIAEAVQVCDEITDENRKRELAGLFEVCAIHSLTKGLILTSAQEEEWTENGVTITLLPTWKYLLL